MDMVPEDQRDQVHCSSSLSPVAVIVTAAAAAHKLQIFKAREAELRQISLPLKITCFRTSIWDETLYKMRPHSLLLPVPLLRPAVESVSVSVPIPVRFSRDRGRAESVQAWSQIVYSLIPNVKTLEANLEKFCSVSLLASISSLEVSASSFCRL
jgi:hypothetical protein